MTRHAVVASQLFREVSDWCSEKQSFVTGHSSASRALIEDLSGALIAAGRKGDESAVQAGEWWECSRALSRRTAQTIPGRRAVCLRNTFFADLRATAPCQSWNVSKEFANGKRSDGAAPHIMLWV